VESIIKERYVRGVVVGAWWRGCISRSVWKEHPEVRLETANACKEQPNQNTHGSCHGNNEEQGSTMRPRQLHAASCSISNYTERQYLIAKVALDSEQTSCYWPPDGPELSGVQERLLRSL
jgi:hypothetical protein